MVGTVNGVSWFKPQTMSYNDYVPPVRITEALLRDLYAAETSVPPTQAPEPLALPARGPRHVATGCKPQ